MTEVPSEKVQLKAAKYLLEGLVRIKHLDLTRSPILLAHVTPESGGDPYFVKFTPSGWHCDCPARVQVCAHILACQTVTDIVVEVKEQTLTTKPNADIDALLADL